MVIENIQKGDLVQHKITHKKYFVLQVRNPEDFSNKAKEMLSGDPIKELKCMNAETKITGELYTVEVKKIKD